MFESAVRSELTSRTLFFQTREHLHTLRDSSLKAGPLGRNRLQIQVNWTFASPGTCAIQIQIPPYIHTPQIAPSSKRWHAASFDRFGNPQSFIVEAWRNEAAITVMMLDPTSLDRNKMTRRKKGQQHQEVIER